ncbi:MAG: AraC family transcriptional regulator [Victivallales bacterium]
MKKYGYRDLNLTFPERTLRVHAAITRCGYSCEKSMQYSWHGMKRGRAEFVLWQLTTAGFGRLEYEGETHQLDPGHAMLLHFPHNHRYFLPGDSDKWEFIYLCMNGREILRICRELEHTNGPVTNYGKNSKTVLLAKDIFGMAAREEIKDIFSASAFAYEFVMNLSREICPHSGNNRGKPDFLRKITDYCLENMGSDISVDTLSGISGYSRFHFSRLFKKHLGIPPAEFLNNLRLKHSVRLLQTERLSIKEISERCGFRNASYFCQSFRKEFGMPPGKFRNSGMY